MCNQAQALSKASNYLFFCALESQICKREWAGNPCCLIMAFPNPRQTFSQRVSVRHACSSRPRHMARLGTWRCPAPVGDQPSPTCVDCNRGADSIRQQSRCLFLCPYISTGWAKHVWAKRWPRWGHDPRWWQRWRGQGRSTGFWLWWLGRWLRSAFGFWSWSRGALGFGRLKRFHDCLFHNIFGLSPQHICYSIKVGLRNGWNVRGGLFFLKVRCATIILTSSQLNHGRAFDTKSVHTSSSLAGMLRASTA